MLNGSHGFWGFIRGMGFGMGKDTLGIIPPLDLPTLFETLMAPDLPERFRAYADSGELAGFMPELAECDRIPGRDRRTTVLGHSIRVCQVIRPELHLRLAALLHDIGKPPTRVVTGHKVAYPEHAGIGAQMAGDLLGRMGIEPELSDRVVILIENHMFQLQPFHSDKAIRRWIRTVGPENAGDLLELRRADIIGSTEAYWMAWGALSLLARRVAEQMDDMEDGTGGDLPVDGNDVMRVYGLEPGPEVGKALGMIRGYWDGLDVKPGREEILSLMESPGDALGIKAVLSEGAGPDGV